MRIVKVLHLLTKEEKHTFKLHIIYSVLDGIILGTLALNDFVLIKSLHGSNYQIGILFQFTAIVLLFAILISALFKQIRNKKKMIRWVAIFTRFPLILMIFFPISHQEALSHPIYPILFLGIFFTYFLANPLLLPTINYILKNSYSHKNFSQLYSYAASANKIVMLVVTFLFGLFLDLNNFVFIYIYPLLGLLGYLSIHILSKISIKEEQQSEKTNRFGASITNSIKNMLDILKRNKAFRDFESAFMLYGFAFMITVAVITIYLEKELRLNYSSVAFYKNAYNIVAIVFIPFFGRLLGKIDPRKFAAITFSFFMFFLCFLAFTKYLPVYVDFLGLRIYLLLIIAYSFNGLFAATMSLVWYIGSAYFARDEEAGEYQSIHLTLTGVRALFAPLFGVWLLNTTSYNSVFYLGAFSLFLAILLMLYSSKKHKM